MTAAGRWQRMYQEAARQRDEARVQAELMQGDLLALEASERNKFSLVELQQAVKDFCMAEPQLWCTCGGIFGFLDFLESIPSKGTE